MNQENCPCCPNHCAKDNLSCGRGREHFSKGNANNVAKSMPEKVIDELRRCGHLLHHNQDLDTKELLSGISEDELNKLYELLSKIQ